MNSFTIRISVVGGVEEFLRTDSWGYLSGKLDSDALGDENFLILGSGSTGWSFSPGEQFPPLLVSPGTSCKVRTNSSTNSNWAFIFTPVPYNELFNNIRLIKELLQYMVCSNNVQIPQLEEDYDINSAKSDREMENMLLLREQERQLYNKPTQLAAIDDILKIIG